MANSALTLSARTECHAIIFHSCLFTPTPLRTSGGSTTGQTCPSSTTTQISSGKDQTMALSCLVSDQTPHQSRHDSHVRGPSTTIAASGSKRRLQYLTQFCGRRVYRTCGRAWYPRISMLVVARADEVSSLSHLGVPASRPNLFV